MSITFPSLKDVFCDWFEEPGAYVLVDGQYGSTGKGVIAAAIAEYCVDKIDLVVSNAGPNSGHTSFVRTPEGQHDRIVLKQLPTAAVVSNYFGKNIPAHLSAGAVIDRDLLAKEIQEHNVRTTVHPHAAVIDQICKEADRNNVQSIASTGQGVGPALQRKLSRQPQAVMDCGNKHDPLKNYLRNKRCFFEVSQGYSLGINSGFYPHVTTRECTVSQALSDAGAPPTFFRKSVLSVRTFPIRVGDTDNTSGPCYFDQEETSWDALGFKPETTTVTGRIRRIFTWSNQQFMEAVWANSPSVIFLNFCNYLDDLGEDPYMFVANKVREPYHMVMGKYPDYVLMGFGPTTNDIQVWS